MKTEVYEDSPDGVAGSDAPGVPGSDVGSAWGFGDWTWADVWGAVPGCSSIAVCGSGCVVCGSGSLWGVTVGSPNGSLGIGPGVTGVAIGCTSFLRNASAPHSCPSALGQWNTIIYSQAQFRKSNPREE